MNKGLILALNYYEGKIVFCPHLFCLISLHKYRDAGILRFEACLQIRAVRVLKFFIAQKTNVLNFFQKGSA